MISLTKRLVTAAKILSTSMSSESSTISTSFTIEPIVLLTQA